MPDGRVEVLVILPDAAYPYVIRPVGVEPLQEIGMFPYEPEMFTPLCRNSLSVWTAGPCVVSGMQVPP
jgi:hypothetical protein